MINSMTAFARQTSENEWGSITWELRSVNHRYLEMYIRLPDVMREQEAAIRALIQKQLNRGKVEAVLSFNPGKKLTEDLNLNESLTRKMAFMYQQATQIFDKLRVDFVDLLNWPGI